MTYLLWSNCAFETLVGLLMIASPKVFLKSDNPLAADFARSLGFALLTVASLSAAMAITHEVTQAGLIALAVFHGSFAVSQFISFRNKFSPPPPMIIHAVFFALFVTALLGKI